MSIQFEGTASYAGGDIVLLNTEIGSFAIPKTEFTDLSPGEYRGRFCLKRVHVTVVQRAMETVVMLGAKLDAYAFDTSEAGLAPSSADTGDDKEALAEDDTDRRLFEPIGWPLGAEVKPDPKAVTRPVFAQQRNRLKQLGYLFNVDRTCWLKAG